jgi:hypothetical protein
VWGSGGGRTVSSYEPGRCNKDACDQRVLPRGRGKAKFCARVEGAARGEGEVGGVGASREAGNRKGVGEET